MDFTWSLVVGPVFALLPRRWRARVSPATEGQWATAATVSGLYQVMFGILGLVVWYLVEMDRLVNATMEAAARGKVGGLTEYQIGGAALTLLVLHPVTWLLAGMLLEGVVRVCSAAFIEQALGTFPLFVVERVMYWSQRPADRARVKATMQEHTNSFVEAIHERLGAAKRKELPDQLVWSKSGADELVEIRATHRKPDWEAPRTVHMGEAFYRLEQNWKTGGERPFRYRLRKVEAGVMGRTVIVYEPPEEA